MLIIIIDNVSRIINKYIKGHIYSRVGTISQSSLETPFKLFRFTLGLNNLKKLLFAQASPCIATVNATKSKWQMFDPSLYTAKFKNLETQQIV